MPQGRAGAEDVSLLERDRELAAIDGLLSRAVAQDGGLLLVEGPAGIGKTTLLAWARERARRAGLPPLHARGGELEREFPYGIVRQLLESPVRTATASRRRRLLSGAAGLATPVIVGAQADEEPAGEFALLHGLYWLVANLAAQSPVALIVDDAQWADAASLRFLIHLARRLEGLPVALIASIRTAEEGSASPLLHGLQGSPDAAVVTVEALSDTAVARLLTADFGRRPATSFVAACRVAAGGNPFLVHELAASLIADGIGPDAEAAAGVGSVGPSTVARATLGRLGHLSEDAVAMARAIAVLGGDATLPRTALVAGLDPPRASAALDTLVGAGIVLASGEPEFNHPIVRAAIYNDLPPGERSNRHRQVAELLAREGAELDAVAGHLLQSRPAGSGDTIATLRAAASHARSVGAPESATVYLKRALAEGCERELRTALLLELAAAEQLAHDPAALTHLEEVRVGAQAPLDRARAAIEQAGILVYSGDWQRPKALVESALIEIGGRDAALSLRAEGVSAGMAAYDPRLVGDLEPRLPALRKRAMRGGDAARPLAMLLAGIDASRGEAREDVFRLLERGWGDGRVIDDAVGRQLLPQVLYALVFYDELDRAREIVDVVREAAGRRGSMIDFLMASTFAASIAAKGGDLTAAEGELRASCETALEHGILFALPTLLWGAIDVLLERPETADLGALAPTLELGPMEEVFSGTLIRYVRATLRIAAGEPAAAIADLRRAGEVARALGFVNPNTLPWRSALATALVTAGKDRDEALSLATAELADARHIGVARGIGVSLRALGLVEHDDQQLAHLEGAVAVLAGSPARLEHARALVELGAARRRRGQRAAAREPLRQGLELAARCGATRLAERARTELTATGARPRRQYTTSRDALTPSELRVARLAAEGRTSEQIAQMLFVTTRTIDAHLQHSYAKLGINSRRQLAAALGDDAS
ncbi:MAG: AAA family ATPase [Solirubrobacteraceae bacterium]|jgi:DNA-binding CsgD family transcriptional regulator